MKLKISQPVHSNMNNLTEEVKNKNKSVQHNEEKKKQLKKEQFELAERISYMRPGRVKSTYVKHRIYKMKHKSDQRKMKDTYSYLERGLNLSLSDSEDSDEEETSKLLQPTPSRRVPKLNNTFDHLEELVDDEKIEAEGESIPENLIPGSMVIVTIPTEDGGTKMQVFMITSTGSQVPLIISPEMLNSLMTQHALLNSQDVSLPSAEAKTAMDDSSLEEAACSADSCDLVIDK